MTNTLEPAGKETQSESNNGVTTLLQAGSWRRFFARMFDVQLETLIVFVVFGLALTGVYPGFDDWLMNPDAATTFGILCLPVVLIFDALLYRRFGNTPGKALAGLRIMTLDNMTLTFKQYMKRNIALWIRGFGLGIPIITLVTFAYQYGRLARGHQASYDEIQECRVLVKPVGRGRELVFRISFLILVVFTAFFLSIGQIEQGDSGNQFTWQNPVTQINADIDSRWRYSVEPHDDGIQLYLFDDSRQNQQVMLGSEQLPDTELEDYVQAVQAAGRDEVRVSSGSIVHGAGGAKVWHGSGNMANDQEIHVDLDIVQVGNVFWRIMVLTHGVAGEDNESIRQLKESLYKTLL